MEKVKRNIYVNKEIIRTQGVISTKKKINIILSIFNIVHNIIDASIITFLSFVWYKSIIDLVSANSEYHKFIFNLFRNQKSFAIGIVAIIISTTTLFNTFKTTDNESKNLTFMIENYGKIAFITPFIFMTVTYMMTLSGFKNILYLLILIGSNILCYMFKHNYKLDSKHINI